MIPGDLVLDDDMRTLMVVDAYTGLYGREICDCVRADRDMGSDGRWLPLILDATWRSWANPLSYFADELSVITDSKEIR